MDTTEIKKVIDMYFDACFEGNGDKMEQVFHDEAHIYSHAPDGSLVDAPKDVFVQRVRSRPADTPSFPREDEILSIEFTGENTAAVCLRLRVVNTRFTDILCFMRLNGKWRIISKLFSAEMIV